MLNDNAKKWVEALRSGRFKQTTGALGDAYGNCCLGVACEIAIENGIILNKTVLATGKIAYGLQSAYLPTSVANWLGLASTTGDFKHNEIECSLMGKNDGGANFLSIADLIESEPPGLFTN